MVVTTVAVRVAVRVAIQVAVRRLATPVAVRQLLSVAAELRLLSAAVRLRLVVQPPSAVQLRLRSADAMAVWVKVQCPRQKAIRSQCHRHQWLTPPLSSTPVARLSKPAASSAKLGLT